MISTGPVAVCVQGQARRIARGGPPRAGCRRLFSTPTVPIVLRAALLVPWHGCALLLCRVVRCLIGPDQTDFYPFQNFQCQTATSIASSRIWKARLLLEVSRPSTCMSRDRIVCLVLGISRGCVQPKTRKKNYRLVHRHHGLAGPTVPRPPRFRQPFDTLVATNSQAPGYRPLALRPLQARC